MLLLWVQYRLDRSGFTKYIIKAEAKK